MKDDYAETVRNLGRLKCPHCGNKNMRKMYQEVSVSGRKNLVSGDIDVMSKIDNYFQVIYCEICDEIVAEL